jgi:hypothetical protein
VSDPEGLDALRAQYARFPYPHRDPEDERTRLEVTWFDHLALVNHHCFGGRSSFGRGFRALVAGMLYQYPGAAVRISSHHGIPIKIAPGRHTLGIVQHLDGERTLRQIFELVREDAAGAPPSDGELLADFRPVFRALNDADMLLLRHRSVPAFGPPSSAQPINRGR